MSRDRIISAFGYIWVLLWLSHVPVRLYPLPYQRYAGVRSFAQEVVTDTPDFIRQESGIGRQTARDVETMLIRETWMIWVKALSFIIGGVLAGVLIIKKKNLGRLIALSLSGYILVLHAIGLFTHGHWEERLSLKSYSLLLEYFPGQTILGMTTFLLAAATVVFFSLRSTIRAMTEEKGT